MVTTAFLTLGLATGLALSQESCPGYTASNVRQTSTGLTADLQLAGAGCHLFGVDIPSLTLVVEYQTASRLHVIIQDQNQTVYQVPSSVLPRPSATSPVSSEESKLSFTYMESPFSFAVSRSDGEVLFNTSGSPLIFESQYLNLRTSLPHNPNLYGLGEHSDPFRLNTTNYTRSIWTRDAYGIPTGSNLYGAHPIYIDHRGERGTHAVILVNSNGMDIKINNTAGQYLEYNTLGGILDFYFVAGPSPIETAQQIAEVVGFPAMIPYAGLGFHQCRYGYQDVYEVAGVVYNYSQAEIPLETMWTDIDYMDSRHIFTLDPERFPLSKVRELVDHLHQHQQSYTVMVDPAVAYVDYDAFNNGRNSDVFLKRANGSIFQGVVWPGVSAFPDWFHPNTQGYWDDEFSSFFSAEDGVDIDYLWIDMNEAANFCNYPCSDPFGYAMENDFPPEAPAVRNGSPIALPGFPPDFQPSNSVKKRQSLNGSMLGLPGRNLINPPYEIQNAAGSLSNKTIDTDIVHYNGLVEYDTHNIYGTMMSYASRKAMLSRRPSERPLIITRSTFLGAGSYVGHWLGDNQSIWPHYRISIAQMLAFASMFQIPMVGSDVCGFGSNTTELLCARWMMLGAFYPFYRNHNELGAISQEAYRWDSVAAAARYAMAIRYQLIDYIYTAIYTQTQTGKPNLNPLFYLYPTDSNTFGIQHQFFYGDAVLVSPVIEENGTTVELYLPDDIFYDWNNGFAPVRGSGANITLENVDFQTMPLHVRGGTILPLRAQSANTTTELRKQPFHLVVALGLNGSASGLLYLDEGNLLEQPSTSLIDFTFSHGRLSMSGNYGCAANVSIETISVLGIQDAPGDVSGGVNSQFTYNTTTQVLTINTALGLDADATITITGTEPRYVAPYEGKAIRSSQYGSNTVLMWMTILACLTL